MNGAIIGGTGFYDAGDLLRTESVETPFGNVDVEIIRHGDSELGFLNRHGKAHSVPPHKVNYKQISKHSKCSESAMFLQEPRLGPVILISRMGI